MEKHRKNFSSTLWAFVHRANICFRLIFPQHIFVAFILCKFSGFYLIVYFLDDPQTAKIPCKMRDLLRKMRWKTRETITVFGILFYSILWRKKRWWKHYVTDSSKIRSMYIYFSLQSVSTPHFTRFIIFSPLVTDLQWQRIDIRESVQKFEHLHRRNSAQLSKWSSVFTAASYASIISACAV